MVREREFRVRIKFAARVSMHQLRELLSGKQVSTPQEALTIIDIVLRELASQRCELWFFFFPQLSALVTFHTF